MTAFEAAVLGLVQGLSEFLPVSSSGHLVLGQALLGTRTGGITFEVLVHFGTLLAVLTALHDRVRALVTGCLRGRSDARWTVLLLALATVPAAAVGFLFEGAIEATFADPRAACGWLILTGAVLFSTRFASGRRIQLDLPDAVAIGLAQAFAILPGVSRSGMTISAGLWRGVDAREAAVFSFLLSVPVILGATAVKVSALVAHPPAWEALVPLLVGTVAAYVAGVVAIRWLLAILRGGRLDRFAYYCWAVGILGLGLLWYRG